MELPKCRCNFRLGFLDVLLFIVQAPGAQHHLWTGNLGGPFSKAAQPLQAKPQPLPPASPIFAPELPGNKVKFPDAILIAIPATAFLLFLLLRHADLGHYRGHPTVVSLPVLTVFQLLADVRAMGLVHFFYYLPIL